MIGIGASTLSTARAKAGEGFSPRYGMKPIGATSFLTEHVDRDGKPNRSSYGDKKTRLERIVEDSVNSSLQKEMKVEIDRVRAELINRAAEAAAAVLARIK